MSKILLDTNILIYAIDEDSRYFNDVRQLLFFSRNELYTTSKNISEFLSVVTRIPHESIPLENALATIQEFEDFLQILYPTSVSFQIFKQLLKEYKPTGLHIHDFEIINIGLANKITVFATYNVKDFDIVKEISLFSLQ